MSFSKPISEEKMKLESEEAQIQHISKSFTIACPNTGGLLNNAVSFQATFSSNALSAEERREQCLERIRQLGVAAKRKKMGIYFLQPFTFSLITAEKTRQDYFLS